MPHATLNGARLHYEVSGQGDPVLLISGLGGAAVGWLLQVKDLSARYQVITLDNRGVGESEVPDLPSYPIALLADDAAALLDHLGVGSADVVGYSLGGGVALQLGIRHPAMVRKMVVASASYTSDGMHEALLEMLPSTTPEMFAGSPIEEAYLRLAPNPADFPALVHKLTQLDSTPFSWSPDEIRGLVAPTLVIVGDSDAVRLEHAVDLFGLLGGGVMGDLVGLPKSQLAVLPATTHFMPSGFGLLDRADWLLAMIPLFLETTSPQTS
jgi:pimeloyl-ACP methyl ester carboxylesterase